MSLTRAIDSMGPERLRLGRERQLRSRTPNEHRRWKGFLVPVAGEFLHSLGHVRLLLVLGLVLSLNLAAHHFKGLPHYNYFDNYPQVPEEEFLGQVGDYEMSLVVYDFQGIDRQSVETPDNVRLFLVIFNLRDNRVYQGRLTLEILDRDAVYDSHRFEQAELENLYSLHRELPDEGRYSLRVTLEDEGGLQGEIPFLLSSQRVHWGRWIAGGLVILVGITAMGARRKRVQMDRRANRLQEQRRELVHE